MLGLFTLNQPVQSTEATNNPWKQPASEILLNIFHYLPVQDLYCCARVSKYWRAAVIAPYTWRNRKYEILERNIKLKTCKVIDFAKGLFGFYKIECKKKYLFFSPNYGSLWVFNHSTGELTAKFEKGTHINDEDRVLSIYENGAIGLHYLDTGAWNRIKSEPLSEYTLNQSNIVLWEESLFVMHKNLVRRHLLLDTSFFWNYPTLDHPPGPNDRLEKKGQFLIITQQPLDARPSKKYFTVYKNAEHCCMRDLEGFNLESFSLMDKEVLWFQFHTEAGMYKIDGVPWAPAHWCWSKNSLFDHISTIFFGLDKDKILAISPTLNRREFKCVTYKFSKHFKEIISFEKIEKWGNYLLISNIILPTKSPISGIWTIKPSQKRFAKIKLVYEVSQERDTHLHQGVFYTVDKEVNGLETLQGRYFLEHPPFQNLSKPSICTIS